MKKVCRLWSLLLQRLREVKREVEEERMNKDVDNFFKGLKEYQDGRK